MLTLLSLTITSGAEERHYRPCWGSFLHKLATWLGLYSTPAIPRGCSTLARLHHPGRSKWSQAHQLQSTRTVYTGVSRKTCGSICPVCRRCKRNSPMSRAFASTRKSVLDNLPQVVSELSICHCDSNQSHIRLRPNYLDDKEAPAPILKNPHIFAVASSPHPPPHPPVCWGCLTFCPSSAHEGDFLLGSRESFSIEPHLLYLHVASRFRLQFSILFRLSCRFSLSHHPHA